MDEKVIFEVDISSLAKGLADAQTQLEIYKRDMENAIESNGRFSEAANLAAAKVQAQSKANQQLEGSILRLTQAEKALGGNINEVVKNYNASEKSVDQNRKVLNALTAEYNKLTGTARTNLIPTIKSISDTLKQQEGVIGDTRRNVGNYGDQFKEVGKNLLSAAGQQIGFNAAMAATPAGAAVEVFSSLFNVLSRNKEVMDLIEQGMSGLTAVIDEASSSLVNFGKSFIESFSGAGGKDAGSFISGIFENSINGYKKFGSALASGDVKEALKGLADGFTGVKDVVDRTTTAIDKAVQAGVEAKKATQDFRDAERALNVELSAQEITIYKLKKASQDRTKSDEDRIKLLKEALRLEQSRAEKELKLSEKGVEAAKKEMEAGKNKDELADKYSQAQVRRNEAYKNSIVFQEKIQNELNALEVSLAKEKTDRENKLLKFETDNSAKTKELADKQIKIDEEKRKSDEDATNKQLDAEVIQAQITAKRVGSVSAQVDAEIIARNRLLQNDKLNATERENIIRASEDNITKIYQAEADKQLAIQQKKEQDVITIINASLQFVSNVIGEIGKAIQDSANQNLENEKNINDERQNNYKRSLDAGLISKKEFNKLSAESDAKLAEETREQNRKAWEANKAIQITMAIINTAQAVIAQLSNPTPYVGIVLSALAAATGAIQIGIIAAQQPPKFAKGVIGLDGAGNETSDSIDAKLSKGESVVTAKATKRYHRELAAMEWSVGNKPNYQFGRGHFAGGFIPNISTDGGFAVRETVRQSDMSVILREAIKTGFSNAPSPKLSIVELENKQRSRNRSVKISEA